MDELKRRFQHCFNPLHLYCRLRELGLSGIPARRLCAVYERLFYRMVA